MSEKKPASSLLIGQAGVWQVASQLAIRGLHPHFPGVDFGYDLLIDKGLRIQVKAANLRHNERVYPEGAYWFKFWQSPIISGRNNIRRRGAYDYSTVSDFVVLWGINENRFWIVPSAIIAKCQGVVVGPKGFHQRQDFAEAKALAATGLNQREIGERLGISQVAVSYQLRGGRKKQPRQTFTAQVRALEDRWDLIIGALATMTDVNNAVVVPSVEDVKV